MELNKNVEKYKTVFDKLVFPTGKAALQLLGFDEINYVNYLLIICSLAIN